MTKKRRARFTVSVDIPVGVTAVGMTAYIAEAVQGWRGGFHPDDPLFDLDRNSIKVQCYETLYVDEEIKP